MADKATTLEIVLRTVDKATAGIRKVAGAINAIGILTAPIALVGERLSGLAKEAGLPRLVEGFKGVGGAVKDLLGKLLLIGGIAAAAVVGLMGLVGGFDDLGDFAERVGTSVDFLAQMRYAAERSGAEVSQLDAGLQGLSSSLGQARAGTGKMTAFLKVVSPELLKQLKAAKDNEAAFLLLARAAKKIEDPAKRAAFAQKTLGDAALAPLLAKGADGIAELRKRYLELAGSQEGAAAAAGPVDDAMKDLKASTDGIKAAIVTGLAPALKIVVDQLATWFVAHRGDIAKWAKDIGDKLPKAIAKVVDTVSSAVKDVTAFVSAIGGLKTVLAIAAAVIVGPLIASIYSLGVAILTTPIGWILAGIAALAAGVYLVIKNWGAISAFFGQLWASVKGAFSRFFDWVSDIFLNWTILGPIVENWEPIKEFFVGLWDGITSVFTKAWDIIKSIVDKVGSAVDRVKGAIDFLNPFSGGDMKITSKNAIASDFIGAALGTQRAAATEARVKVEFADAPRGTRVSTDPQSTADVDLSVGYLMGFGS